MKNAGWKCRKSAWNKFCKVRKTFVIFVVEITNNLQFLFLNNVKIAVAILRMQIRNFKIGLTKNVFPCIMRFTRTGKSFDEEEYMRFPMNREKVVGENFREGCMEVAFELWIERAVKFLAKVDSNGDSYRYHKETISE